MSRLDVDRYGVPQYGGEPELYEEYAERCWDLWFGREGHDTQAATPIHLRSGLTGTAYSAVRKLDHPSLITKDSAGKPSDKGLRLLLQTLKDNIAQEAPVKTNELFFQAFYSPLVWRMPAETMQQYIVRREQDFKRLEEVLAGAKIPDHIRAMMLLAFGGLDSREQLNVLASVNNEYDFKKIGHALRIQYPTCSGKPVYRKDYLGCHRAPAAPVPTGKGRPKPFLQKSPKGKSRGYALVAEEEELEGEEAFLDEADQDYDEDAYEAAEASDDDPLEALVQEYDFTEDPEYAEALATVIQKRKGSGSPGKGGSQTFPFRAKGEMTLDQKAKETRRNAVKFLKTVTPCTVCGQKGHWAGDAECPQAGRKKGGAAGQSPKRKPFAKKKPSAPSTFFVDGTEGEDANFEAEVFLTTVAVPPPTKFGTFSNMFELAGAEAESFMVLRAPDLCEHATYNGGEEKKFHRSANGHVRQVLCKESECDRAVIQANRKEPTEMWKFLTLVALGTRWGKKARHRVWLQTLHHAELEAAELKKPSPATLTVRLQMEPQRRAEPAISSTGPWQLVGENQGYSTPSSLPSTSSTAAPVARIVRHETMEQKIWVYGVCVSASLELPPFPQLAAEDLDILQPVPADEHVLGTSSPFAGRLYVDVASSSECSWWCTQVIGFALGNHPMRPDIYAFGFYLYGRLTLIREAVVRMQGAGTDPRKRVHRPEDMVSTRQLRVPVAMDPQRLDITTEQDCDVMMVVPGSPSDSGGEEVIPHSYVASELDPPGLAILDSGCTKTMHGAAWAKRFEAELEKLGLNFEVRHKTQTFKGVGGHIQSDVVKVYPVGLAKVHGEMCSSEAPGPLPLLLSRPFMEEMGTVMDIGRGTVSFAALGVKDLPLVKTSRGHLAVDLLDFDRASLSDNEFSQPGAEDHEEEQTLVTAPAGRDTGAPTTGQHLTPEEIAELQDRYLADGGPDDSSSIP